MTPSDSYPISEKAKLVLADEIRREPDRWFLCAKRVKLELISKGLADASTQPGSHAIRLTAAGRAAAEDLTAPRWMPASDKSQPRRCRALLPKLASLDRHGAPDGCSGRCYMGAGHQGPHRAGDRSEWMEFEL